MKTFDVIVIGGGVMGAFTARALAKKGASVAMIEQYKLFNPYSASGGKTRSFRQDYLDPFYTKLALQAGNAWDEFERETGAQALLRCGCLNLWDSRLGISWEQSYAAKAAQALEAQCAEFAVVERHILQPAFSCEQGTLDIKGGVLCLNNISRALESELKRLKVTIFEHTRVAQIVSQASAVRITTSGAELECKSAAIASGRWAPEILTTISGTDVPEISLSLERPLSSVYCSAQNSNIDPSKLPVFACLDVGIYGHPMLLGETPGIKIGVFQPKSIEEAGLEPWSLERFLETFMPEISRFSRIPVQDTDLCSYDNTQDGDFIIGSINERISIATGFCGTGYKFAPLVGTWLSEGVDGNLAAVPERFSPYRPS